MSNSSPIKIGVACPIPGERAAFLEWLGQAGYEPVPIEVLIADVSLIPAGELPRVVKTLGPNRPLVLVGNPEEAIEEVPRDAAWIERPVNRETFLLSIALALAEGRPARRSPRRRVPKLLASVDGVSSRVVDVSAEGVRLEVTGVTPSALPPYFTLRVPGFGVAAKVKRVWVATPAQGSLWCGGIIERQATAMIAWHKFLQNAPAGSTTITEIRAIT
jgi:hypothetical protein